MKIRASLSAIFLLIGLQGASAEPISPVGPGIPPPGFVVAPWAAVPAPTSLAFGPDGSLYASSFDGHVYVMANLGPAGGPPAVFADGLSSPLGVLVDDDGTVFVADSHADSFGVTSGRVRAFRDTNGDGAADTDEVVVDGLPNGRHNTNGMAFGPDGMLYIANGNRTDDGLECGPDILGSGVACPLPEAQPYSGALLRVNPALRNQGLGAVTVVATGMRNIYDVAFRPGEPSMAYIPMNGPDDPAADDVLYRTDVLSAGVDDFDFPSCLYNQHLNPFMPDGTPDDHSVHGLNLTPQNNLNANVTNAFGACPVSTVPRPIATFGGHVSANGLAFAPSSFAPEFAGDVFVAEWGNLWGIEDGYLSGHKVVRVPLEPNGLPAPGEIHAEDFLSGALPIDLVFGPDGAMYVADMAGAILRVAKVV